MATAMAIHTRPWPLPQLWLACPQSKVASSGPQRGGSLACSPVHVADWVIRQCFEHARERTGLGAHPPKAGGRRRPNLRQLVLQEVCDDIGVGRTAVPHVAQCLQCRRLHPGSLALHEVSRDRSSVALALLAHPAQGCHGSSPDGRRIVAQPLKDLLDVVCAVIAQLRQCQHGLFLHRQAAVCNEVHQTRNRSHVLQLATCTCCCSAHRKLLVIKNGCDLCGLVPGLLPHARQRLTSTHTHLPVLIVQQTRHLRREGVDGPHIRPGLHDEPERYCSRTPHLPRGRGHTAPAPSSRQRTHARLPEVVMKQTPEAVVLLCSMLSQVTQRQSSRAPDPAIPMPEQVRELAPRSTRSPH
mmetsp:Transcript_85529/g.242476  ORF Transcript_85529/g.242476 Transcript_85529/m.242476 type:complete len:355 (-) Transcript_85529:774-1838(-)